MARKRWAAQTEVTPELIQAREKRKWQITLRRYVVEQSACPAYAPYFGLDITRLRNWFECQFTANLSWDNFGESWQFSHIIPLSYFDQSNNEDLRLCWNFINLRVEPIQSQDTGKYPLDILGAKQYLTGLYAVSGYPPAKELAERLARIEKSQLDTTQPQQQFISNQKDYLAEIQNYQAFEFELLNHGHSIAEIDKELALLNKNLPN